MYQERAQPLRHMGVFHVDNPGGENMAMQRYLVRTDKLQTGEGTAVTTGARYRFAPDWFSVDLEDEGVELRRWLLDNDAQATLARDRRLHVPVSGALRTPTGSTPRTRHWPTFSLARTSGEDSEFGSE